MQGLVVSMYWHAMIGDGMDVLDVGSGSGYGAALPAYGAAVTVTSDRIIRLLNGQWRAEIPAGN